jgi:phosphate:Na+ symporter
MALFLYGMFMCRDGIQHFAGERLKTIISSMTTNRFSGLLLGGIMTVAFQSSTALTVILVGLAHSQMISLAQTMPILLGADMGTTLTVQLIAFRVDRYALLIVTIGFIIQFFAKKQRVKFLGTLVFGFGLIFFGMKLMVTAVEPLKHVPEFSMIIDYLGRSPVAALAVAMAFTGLVLSSAATIGLVISLAMAGAMSLDAAVPMVLGANIGTCFAALITGMGSGASGKRVAVAHVMWKVAGVALFWPFMPHFISLVKMTAGDTARQIANAHTIFNVSIALVFLPATGLAAALLVRLFRDDEEKEKPFGPEFLDPSGIQTPALALGYVTREVARMAAITKEMLKKTQPVFELKDRDMIDQVMAMDDKIDVLDRSVKFYLARVNKTVFSHEQADRELELVSDSSDLEAIGDIISKGIMDDARKYIMKGLSFSTEGAGEMALFHARVIKNFDSALAAFEMRDCMLARQVMREKTLISELEQKLKQTHLSRLHAGLKESFETSSIHIEYISNLSRINSLSTRLASRVLMSRSDDERLENAVI